MSEGEGTLEVQMSEWMSSEQKKFELEWLGGKELKVGFECGLKYWFGFGKEKEEEENLGGCYGLNCVPLKFIC